ncbi:hypothetical protein [Actinocatenispora rupis]|uniref:Uncharacterized protein n=1 Tax=Actinocatenispora rupis TaxID=519421 RepID=A0A8J3NA16_9ACTN|nr:hypothetical protein [Actinocatenispora rupis]GID11899.1 hypothetical protein Aru02nite_27880 [Actinocatenispora rupis]
MGDGQEWVAVVVDDEGGYKFLGSADRRAAGGKDFTRHRGRAARFDSEVAALAAAQDLRREYEGRAGYRGWITRVEARPVD